MTDARTDKHDRFAVSYGVSCALCLFILASSQELERMLELNGIVLTLLALLSGIVNLIWLAIALAVHLVARRRRRVASILCGPPLAFTFVAVLTHAGIDLTWLRFETIKSHYAAELDRQPRNEPRLVQWEWGDTGFAVTASSEATLVFDESDEIAASSEQRSAAWERRAERTGVANLLQSEYLSSIRHLDGHFYLVDQWFP